MSKYAERRPGVFCATIFAMTLHESLKESLKTALKARDEVKLRTIRSMLTSFTNELVATGSTPQGILTDEKALTVIKRLAKQRRESIMQYESAGRTDLSELEKEELSILESYLPAQLGESETKELVAKKLTELQVTDSKKAGMVIGAILKETGGNVDGALVKRLVEESFR